MVKMLCEINPEYRNHVIYSNNRKQQHLYGKLKKTIYSTLMGAILFYNKKSGQLEEWDFEKNPHDEYTFNKMVDSE